MIIELCGALFSSIFGCITIFSKKEPLFYRIIFFAMLSCLMGNVYTVLYNMLWQADGTGFHVGYLGYIGMFLFLHSSYYGAINSLADGGQAEFKKYRISADAVFFSESTLDVYHSDSHGIYPLFCHEASHYTGCGLGDYKGHATIQCPDCMSVYFHDFAYFVQIRKCA